MAASKQKKSTELWKISARQAGIVNRGWLAQNRLTAQFRLPYTKYQRRFKNRLQRKIRQVVAAVAEPAQDKTLRRQPPD